MKLSKVSAVALFLFISTSSFTQAATSFMQIRNSLWVFGVNNTTTTEVEMVQQGIPQFSEQLDKVDNSSNIISQQPSEVPEELNMAIVKFES